MFRFGFSHEQGHVLPRHPPPSPPREPTPPLPLLPEARDPDPVAVAMAAAAQAMGITSPERVLPETEASAAREYLQEANRECNESAVTIQRAREEIVSGALRVKYEIAAHSQFLIKAVRKRQVELMKSVDCIEEQQHTRLHYLQQVSRGLSVSVG